MLHLGRKMGTLSHKMIHFTIHLLFKKFNLLICANVFHGVEGG